MRHSLEDSSQDHLEAKIIKHIMTQTRNKKLRVECGKVLVINPYDLRLIHVITHTHTDTHTEIHTYTHTERYTHTHTHTHTPQITKYDRFFFEEIVK